MSSFWHKLNKPFFVLAPMANVTDAAFRRIIAKYGKPDVMYTEFVSADGLARGNRGVLLRDLVFSESERPIVAQFFTSDTGAMEEAAALAAEHGFDGVDINMGCPDKSVEKQGAGAALMRNQKRARELIAAAKRGAKGLPVSVKTRIGYNKDELETWLPELLEEEPAAIIIHVRTRKEMSKVPAHWERVKRAVEIRDSLKSATLIVGNGDLSDLADARAKCDASAADGAMLGRGIFGNPRLFSRESALNITSLETRLGIMVEHTKLFEELLGDVKNFAIMKKHYKAYVEGFDGAKALRMRLMEAENAAAVERIVLDFLQNENKIVR